MGTMNKKLFAVLAYLIFLLTLAALLAPPSAAATHRHVQADQGCADGKIFLYFDNGTTLMLDNVPVYAMRLEYATTTRVEDLYQLPLAQEEPMNFTTHSKNGQFSFCAPPLPTGYYRFQAIYNGTMYDSGTVMALDPKFFESATVNIAIRVEEIPMPAFPLSTMIGGTFIAALIFYFLIWRPKFREAADMKEQA